MEIVAAELAWREQIPVSIQFDDVYFTTTSLDETDAVFLRPNALAARFAATTDCFVIGETGFGTGLNSLASIDLWLKTAPSNAVLHYYSVEKYPVTLADLKQVYYQCPFQLPVQDLLDHYPPLTPGWHHLSLFNARVQLHLYFGDALLGYQSLLALAPSVKVDAWFLDGFAPSKNAQMWSLPLMETVFQLSRLGTTLSTFTAATMVRQHLQQAGFFVEKIPGYGRKREMLYATCVHG